MIDHELCETLCVLAASGQLAEAERERLALHCLQCGACREHLVDLSFVGSQLLRHAAPARFKLPEGSLDRFRARAVREGIPLRQPSTSGWLSYGLASALVAALFFCAVPGASVHRTPATSVHAVVAVAARGDASGSTGPVAATVMLTAHPRRSQVVRQRALPGQGSLGAPTQTAFAAMRVRGAISSLYPFIEAKPSSEASLYPALSGMELRRLDLFRALKKPPANESFRTATLECPAEPSSAGCSFDFASNIRQLRFQIPGTP